ncbi:MAG TPA: DUF5719 family protein [Actinomycetota bacterium]|nr:DUF5719 family protein [Actinomycetota bacterium]
MAEGGRSGVRSRRLAVLLLLAAVAGSGLALDRAVAPGAPPPPAATVWSGAWFCPHGGGRGWRGWVVLANPGDRAASVRLTSLGSRGVRGVEWARVPPLALQYRPVPAGQAGAATVVEAFGGWVGAATVLEAPGGGAAASRCVTGTRSRWSVLDQPTGEGERAFLVVMNPFAVPAQFDVVIRTERRTIRPSSLTPVVVPPRTSVAVKLNEYALEAPGEPTVTAEVVRRTGRVVAGGLGVTPGGVRGEVGVGAPASDWTGPAPGAAGEAGLTVLNPGAASTELALLSLERAGERVLSAPQGLSVGAEGVLSVPVRPLRGGLVLEASGPPGVAAALVLGARGGDTATVGLATAAGRSWLVLPAGPPDRPEGRQVVLLVNPGKEPARVLVRLLGPGGLLGAPRWVMVPEGSSLRVDLEETGRPAGLALRATGGGVVAGVAWVGPGGRAGGGGREYAATLGVPWPTR